MLGRDFKLSRKNRLAVTIDVIRCEAGRYTYNWPIYLYNYKQISYPINRIAIKYNQKSINNWFIFALNHSICLWVVSWHHYFFYPISLSQLHNSIFIFRPSVNNQFFVTTNNIFSEKICNNQKEKVRKGFAFIQLDRS